MITAVDNEFSSTGGKRRAIPGVSAAEERLLAMVTALTGELAITRERLDTLERVLESNGGIAQAGVETFIANEAQVAERTRLRRRIIAKVFRPLRESAERDVIKAQKAMADATSRELKEQVNS
ncbi:MAG: hypothetical protein ACI87W_003481 [Halieaceae bacterium]|jgi:hypothetical protein